MCGPAVHGQAEEEDDPAALSAAHNLGRAEGFQMLVELLVHVHDVVEGHLGWVH